MTTSCFDGSFSLHIIVPSLYRFRLNSLNIEDKGHGVRLNSASVRPSCSSRSSFPMNFLRLLLWIFWIDLNSEDINFIVHNVPNVQSKEITNKTFFLIYHKQNLLQIFISSSIPFSCIEKYDKYQEQVEWIKFFCSRTI